MSDEQPTGSGLVDPKVNIRILLAAFWIGHFMLWTFGDMLALLQERDEPIEDSLILFVAPTTAIVQALMIVVCLVGSPSFARPLNLVVTPVYLLFNIGFIAEAADGWEYYLGIFYLVFNGLILWHAYKWPREE